MILILSVLLCLNVSESEARKERYPSGKPISKNQAAAQAVEGFTFAVAADMRYFSGEGEYDTSAYFRGALEAISVIGNVSFLVSPGDLDPASSVYWTITHTLGIDFRWYPVVGNHDLPGNGVEEYYGANLNWFHSFNYGTVNPGPSGCPQTTYSVDYMNAHLVMLNVYCDSAGENQTSGDISEHLYSWLEEDLQTNTQPFTFVFGHEPAFPQPDADNGRIRHNTDSLNQFLERRDRFWQLLRRMGVKAYICGHTHNYSATFVMDMWQFDAGHARGWGDPGAPSTFILIHVVSDGVSYQTYRDDANGGAYQLIHAGELEQASSMYLPVIFFNP